VYHELPRTIPRIAGQDPVACAGQQYDGCVNRVAGASQAQQHTGLPAVLGTDRADIHRAQQLGQDGLAALAVTPDLGDDHGVAAQRCAMLLSHTQPGHHPALPAVDGGQCACLQDQCAHAGLSADLGPGRTSPLVPEPAGPVRSRLNPRCG